MGLLWITQRKRWRSASFNCFVEVDVDLRDGATSFVRSTTLRPPTRPPMLFSSDLSEMPSWMLTLVCSQARRNQHVSLSPKNLKNTAAYFRRVSACPTSLLVPWRIW